MILAEALASSSPDEIKKHLFSLLNQITSPEILQLDEAFNASANKHDFLSKFEALGEAPPECSPAALEKLTHYRWIRLELIYLINQKASLNAIMMTQSAIQQHLSEKEPQEQSCIFPALDSIDQAIQEGVARGISIEESIRLLQQMTLQIVGTEHPTDPLSQEARDTLTKIANAMNDESPSEDNIRALLSNLMCIDAIPHAKRTVPEEVNRNIHITLDKLYDNIPRMVHDILRAYKTHYGEPAYLLHENAILKAIEGGFEDNGVVVPPLFRDASWPGFDADGNANLTPAEMRNSIRLYRIRAAEKHIKTLETVVSSSAKKIERELREKLCDLGSELTLRLMTAGKDIPSAFLEHFCKNQTMASKYLIDRAFYKLMPLYVELSEAIKQQGIDGELAGELTHILDQQKKQTHILTQLIAFSGCHKIDMEHQKGALQQFQQLFSIYKAAILDNTDAITLKNDKGESMPASQCVIEKYRAILETHADILNHYPELKQQFRYFGIQLHCFGMTYGVGHIRQDSSIFEKVWNAIFSDLKLNEVFLEHPMLQPLKAKNYIDLTTDERFALHKSLQDGSEGSKKILKAVHGQYENSAYASRVDDKDFFWTNSELYRFKLATLHKDMIENIIIANCESAANILEVESLLAVFPESASCALTIVPLLEKCEDLKNHEAILLDYIKTKIQQAFEAAFDREARSATQPLKEILNIDARGDIQHWMESKSRHEFSAFLETNPRVSAYLNNITIEIMVGFSDTERVSGLSALISIQKVQEDFVQLTADFGVRAKIYHGPGGDRNRGGPQLRQQKATLQGNARDVLNTPTGTQWFRENQFYQAYTLLLDPSKRMKIAQLPAEMKDWLAVCVDEGTAFYERLHDSQDHFGQLMGLMLGQGVHWMVSILNSSSRAASRGGPELAGDRTAPVQTGGVRPERYVNLGTLRAITSTQMKEMLGDSIDLIGPCYGLRKIGMEKSLWLYDQCEPFRDMVTKETMGVATRNLAFVQHALFADHPELLAKDEAELNAWAEECRSSYPTLLQTMNIKKMSTDPTQQTVLLKMLSRLFAYITVEFNETALFLRLLKNTLKREPTEDQMSMLSHYPEWDKQTADIMEEAELLNYLIARLTHHVARGKNLDQVYQGLNDEVIPNSQLTPTGRLVGNVGAGAIASLRMQPAYVFKFADYSKDIPRQGFERAKKEMPSIERLRHHDKRVLMPLGETSMANLIGFFSQHIGKQGTSPVAGHFEAVDKSNQNKVFWL